MAQAENPNYLVSEKSRGAIRGLRWWIVGLIFLVTCINYIDRTSIGLLFTQFGSELGISKQNYGWVGALLLLAYTISQTFSGRLYDRFGARVGFAVSVLVWCVAAMAHSAIVGFGSFAVCSFFLGLGEAGNWPGAAKVIAEWFPQRQRAIGTAIFNSGASIGAVLAPLLVARLFAPTVGWRKTFLIVGALGLLWLIPWLSFYHPMATHPRLSREERNFIREGQEPSVQGETVPFSQLLTLRPLWGILMARFIVDPVWWLYILWLPVYLKDVRHFNLKEIGVSAWAPYLAAAGGSLFGGWLSGFLIVHGMSVNAARKWVIGAAACMMPFGILAARATTTYAALAYIAVVLFGFQMWISNVQTLPSDYFSHGLIATVAGMGGTTAGVSSLIFNLCTATLVTHFGYAVVLTIAGLLAPLGLLCFLLLSGRIHHLTLSGDAAGPFGFRGSVVRGRK